MDINFNFNFLAFIMTMLPISLILWAIALKKIDELFKKKEK